MINVEIICAKSAPHLLPVFQAWLVGEWPDIGEIEKRKFGAKIPEPLLAVELWGGETHLLGGATFTRYKNPQARDIVIWLNAVYVTPEKRRLGIASRLIKSAQTDVPLMYVLTDLPQLYLNLGWQTVTRGNQGIILRSRR